MICIACREQKHEECKPGCDCQHVTTAVIIRGKLV